MAALKQIKDLVHGYISIDDVFIPVINTPAFQRLKRIEQTSYRVLYPSAGHDRFSHSLGVYWLGRQVFDSIHNNALQISDMNELERKVLKKTFNKNLRNAFLAACLLHDVGHAPFSHTCEDYFNKDKIVEDLIKKIKHKKFDSDSFKTELSKPHELMSAYLSLKSPESLHLTEILKTRELKEFFVRAIIGSPYDTTNKYCSSRKESIEREESLELSLKNVLIRILNSSLIDVDKLDYIVRDAAVSGYHNVQMDLARLLPAFTVILREIKHNGNKTKSNNKRIFWPAYNKSALSVIEHVFIARNNEIRWIQSHNAVEYEALLIQRSIENTLENMGEKDVHRLFSYDALTEKGVTLSKGKFRVCYLSDDDIMHLLKTNTSSCVDMDEYLNRNIRKKAIWKNHSEYIATFGSFSDEVYRTFTPFMLGENKASINVVTKKSLSSFFDEDPSSKSEIDKYLKFFESLIEGDDNEEWEYLFFPYNAERLSRKINGDEIYINYGPSNHKKYSEIMCDTYYSTQTENKEVNDDSKNVEQTSRRGFYVYYKQVGKKIDPEKFINTYNRFFSNCSDPQPS